MFSWIKRQKFPPPEWFKSIATPLHTPDKALLQNQEKHLLFEYGELQAGLPKNGVIKSKPLCPAFTVEKFSLWKKNEGDETFPLALRLTMKNSQNFRAKVCGQLYAVDTQEILPLDNYRLNGVSFIRKRAPLVLPYQDANGNPMQIRAWMYAGNAEHWKEQLDWDTSFYKSREGSAFNMVKMYHDDKPWIRNFFHFTRREYTPHNGRPKCFLWTGGITPDEPPKPK